MPGRLELKSVGACEREDWSLLTWPKALEFNPQTGELRGDGKALRRPFYCGSWRCRRCARWRGAVDWARCTEAVKSRRWWLYVVLTFDPGEYGSRWEAFREAGANWNDHLRTALRTFAGGKFEYLQTWESHKSRWPHANLMLTGSSLEAAVHELGVEPRRIVKNGRERETRFPKGFRRWLVPKLPGCGFGEVAWAEVITPENPERMAGYLIKLARELTGAVGGAKSDQAPVDAPRHFRRIRASRGLLPPQKAGKGSGAFTGTLAQTALRQGPSGARRTGERRPSEEAELFDVARELANTYAAKWAGVTPAERLGD